MSDKKAAELRKRVEVQKEDLSSLEAKKTEGTQKLKELNEALKEAEWQAKLEVIDTKIAPLFREVLEKESEIAREINQFIKELRPGVLGINEIFTTIQGLKGEIKDIESGLVQNGDRAKLEKTFKLKYEEIGKESEVEEKNGKYFAIVKYINSNLGLQEKMDKLPFQTRDNLSGPAFQVYSVVLDRGKQKPLRVRESDLLKLARISEKRIIDARDRLGQYLEELKTNSLITYERVGDSYNIQVAR